VSESQAEGTPSAEQLIEELRKAKVSDLLVHTCSLLASLGYGKLAPEARDLEQARLAIEALMALAPLLAEEPRRDIQQVVANLQLAFADAAAPPREPAAEQPSDPDAGVAPPNDP
jgi:hypothetical protein